MSIEQDIQQKIFKSVHQKLTVNLMFTNNWLCAQQAELFKSFGLSIQQYNVLRILRGQHPQAVTVNTIIERMMDRMSNASRLVDKLLLKELVTRTGCPNDRRAVDVKITEKGLVVLARIDDLQESWEQNLTILNVEEVNQLNALLDKLRNST